MEEEYARIIETSTITDDRTIATSLFSSFTFLVSWMAFIPWALPAPPKQPMTVRTANESQKMLTPLKMAQLNPAQNTMQTSVKTSTFSNW